MAKQLNVNLAFTADTGKAKQQLQDLQSSLDKLISNTNMKTGELGLTKELAKASTEASKLKMMLDAATTPAGTLDLGKFSQNLKKSGLELKDYAATLQALGPEGAKTFAKLAQSITTANIPLKQTNRLLHEFATTMKNTIRWQFSSSMLHGFMGTMSSALGYAKDLDKSLNNIRIVTGYNTDQMAKFAEEANKAAKSLSSTTTNYTNASLIYYQQGLPEDQIAERTEVTLKMANAAGVSAEKISDQMTAVWNNFDDGSKSLEYYADVMTALGAATASSTDEISQGLNKFAAVAETVGLSYEYATAALATVTATTRESADIVGTAFKTLFARIQGLNLGETLDDGTTLNKYSTALAKVGIDIKNTNGDMKQMNTILDEMGAKWDTLAKDEQVALAQTVAGVRQYTQLMALMDNWDYFKENLKVAENSTGTLKEQAEIYAESWEASSKRVKAAAEGIYDKLLDEKFFIGVNKILEGTLSHIGNLIDGLGGLPGVLSVVASLMLNSFGKDIAASIERIAYNIKLTSKAGREEILQLRKDANKQMASMHDDGSISGSTSVDVYKQESKLQEQILQKTFELEARNKTLTEEEQKQVGLLVDKNHELGQQVIHLAQAREQQEVTVKSLQSQLLQKTQYTDKTKIAGLNEELAKIKEQQVVYSTFQPLFEKLRDSAEKIVVGGKTNNLTQYRTEVQALEKSLKETGLTIDDITSGNTDIISAETVSRIREFFSIAKTGSKEEIQKALQDIQDDLAAIGADAELNFQKLKNSLNELDGVDKAGINKLLSEIQSSFMETGRLSEEQIQKFKNLGIQIDESGRIIQGFNGKIYTTADSMVALAHVITGLNSALNMIKGLGNIWSDEDTTYGEKMIATLSSVAMILPTLINAYKTWNSVKLTGVKNDLLALATQKLKNNTDQKGLVVKFSENALQKIKNKELSTEIVLKTILNALDLKKIAIYAALALAIGAVVAIGKMLYDQYHADAQGAKEAAEQAKILTERYEELKNKAQELNDAIADYQDAKDALADLEKGTDEYAAALENANEKAKELIETYGLWNDYNYENGLITIKPKALEDAQNRAREDANQAEAQMYHGEIYSNQADIRNETTQTIRNSAAFGTGTYSSRIEDNNGNFNQVENYRKLTEDEAQIIASIATELKESLGGVNPTAEQLIEKLNELGNSSGIGTDALEHLNTIITEKSISGFLSLGESMAEAEAANRYYAEQILGIKIEEDRGSSVKKMVTDEDGNVDNVKYDQIITALTKRAANLEDEKDNNIQDSYEAVENNVKDISTEKDLNKFLDQYETDNNELINKVLGEEYDGKINNDEELGLLYAQMLSGIDQSELTYVRGNGVGTVKDKDGNEIVSGISDEVMRREIAKQVAMQSITDDYVNTVGDNEQDLNALENAFQTLISGAGEAEKEFGADFSGAILDAIANENFESLNFSNLFSELDPAEMAKLSGLDSQGILDLLGIDEATLTALGYNVDSFTAAFSNALNEWVYTLNTTDIEQRASDLKGIADNAKVGDIIDQEAYDKLNAAGINANKYFTQMEDGTFKLTGAAKEFQNIVENITVEDYINKIKEFNAAQEYAQSKVSEKYADVTSKNVLNTAVVSESTQLGAARAEYISTFEGDFGFTDEQKSLLSKNSDDYTPEDLQELANMVDVVISKSEELQGQLLSTADSLDELNSRVKQASIEGVSISYNAYSEALISLASSYENCTKEIERYQQALANGNEEEVFAAECVLKSSIRIGEAAEKYDLAADSLEAQAKELMIANEWGEEYAETAAIMAIQNQRLNKGVEKLSKNWKDWKKILNSVDKTSQDYADVLVELSDAVENLTGWYEELNLDSKFVSKNMSLIEKSAEGDMDAIISLSAEVAKFSVEMATLNETIASGNKLDGTANAFEAYREGLGSATSAAQAFEAVQAGVQSGFDNIINNITALQNGKMSLDEAFGDRSGLEAWVAQLNAYAAATGMTAQQMQAMLSSVGVTANVQTDYQEQDITVPTYREEVTDVHLKPISGTRVAFTPLGNAVNVPYTEYVPIYTRASVPAEPLKTKGYVEVASISMDKPGEPPGVAAPTFTGRQAPSTSATSGGKGGGGGGSTPAPAKKAEVSKRSDYGERYHTVNKQLDNMTREMERASKAADKLWSRSRLKFLADQNKMLDQEIALLRQKQQQAENYLKLDQAELNKAAADAGLSISYGVDGEILNYDAIMDALASQMIAAQNTLNSFATQDEQDAYQESVIQPLQDKIDVFEEAMDLYYDSLETIQDTADEIQDRLDQQLQNNFDMWSGELELDIQINEKDLELLEYYLSKIEDDVYQMAEAAALMVGSLDGISSGKFGGQLGEYLGNLDIYGTKLDELNQKFEAGEITEAAYEEGLEEIRSGLLDNLSSVQELDAAMLEYYDDTLSMVMEEMDKYTEKLEHQTSILEHYANMMEILGKTYDYDSMGKILEGQVKTIENELAVAEAEFELYQSEAEEKRKLYEEAVAAGNVDAAEVYKKEWEAAEEAAMEAQSEMLDKTEQWAEAMRAVVENNLKGLAKTLEESLTGGTTFDQITLQLQRAASLQEEYLTTTNKIYETNKLMRTAQQEIDKSSNTVAKQRLKDFIKETNQLQNKSKLSKYELEIQQAKYDLLLAQLALEDAQNAKSTVRLQRDSEGNFGYVYTADQNQLLEAQQKLEDAQNNLYNIGLEGANDYAQKYAETMQEMYDTLTGITEAYFNGEIASREEYEAQMLAAQQYYYEQLENYQDLYGIALQTDTRVIKDAWSTGMQIMTIETDTWQNAVQVYTEQASKAMIDWYDKVDQIANKTGLDNIAQKVSKVTEESDKLKDKILGTNGEDGVIQALAAELKEVGNLINKYAEQRAGLRGVIQEYENLINKVMKLNQEMNNYNSTVNYKTPTIPSSNSGSGTTSKNVTPVTPTTSSTPSSGGNGGSGGSGGGGGGGGKTPSTPNYHGPNGVTAEDMKNGATAGGQKVWVYNGKMYYSEYEYNKAVYQDRRGFDTGGYTGSWGPDGKWAMLHEKELVLNKEDTVNFLASMEVLERILEIIDIQSASAQIGGLLHTPSYGGNNTSQTVEQSVHIEASFPGVSDRNEIEEAFNNLINTASQYANRK